MKKTQAAVIAIVLLVCVGFGAYLVMRNRQPEPGPAPSIEAPPIEEAAEPGTVKVYRVSIEDSQRKLHATEETVQPGEDPIETAIVRLIRQERQEGLVNPIPKDTRLLGLEIDEDLAVVDFSAEFRDNFAGGAEDEALTIGAVLKTLGQFPEIKRVKFLVEGQPLDSLGHLDLSGPQEVGWVGSQFGGE